MIDCLNWKLTREFGEFGKFFRRDSECPIGPNYVHWVQSLNLVISLAVLIVVGLVGDWIGRFGQLSSFLLLFVCFVLFVPNI